MQRVIVNMHNILMSQVIEQTLKSSGEFYTMMAGEPQEIAQTCDLFQPDILLMEIAESKPWCLEERIQTGNEARKRSEGCKVVVLVDENANRKVTEQVKQAKRDGQIDQFIYGSSSASFLVALMETL